MKTYPIFLINLDGSSARLHAAEKALKHSGREFTRISAYDGRQVDPMTVDDYDSKGARSYMGRDLNGGEIGCFYSHIRAAKAFLETDAPFGLVLEDDMQPNEQAFELTQALIDWQNSVGTPDWYLANLAAHRLKITTDVSQIAARNVQVTVCRGHYFPMRTTALLWTRQGAEEFLRVSLPMTCPVDNFARRWLTTVDKGITTTPALFTTTGAQSDIDTSRTAQKRGKQNRAAFYGFKKMRRMYGDKLRALRHKMNFATRQGD
tara:strand:- start:1084 stop:1869 length:786 start_codon:yes stop_codon:yes gene_type:complete